MLSPSDGDFCLTQAKRLGVFGYLGDEEAEEFAEAFRGAFDTREQVAAAVDEFVRWDARPVPAQIWHHARQARGESVRRWHAPCDGTGWLPATFRPANPDGITDREYEGVKPCSCRAGGGM